jgi:hypothetical protein
MMTSITYNDSEISLTMTEMELMLTEVTMYNDSEL